MEEPQTIYSQLTPVETNSNQYNQLIGPTSPLNRIRYHRQIQTGRHRQAGTGTGRQAQAQAGRHRQVGTIGRHDWQAQTCRHEVGTR